MGRLIAFEELSSIRDMHPGKTIVQCHGVFDLLHYGHLLHLRAARQHGELLVVSTTGDIFVNKGPGRPRFPDVQRASMLAALEDVDFVVINKHATAVPAIEALHPDVFVKGPDYAAPPMLSLPELAAEQAAVERCGGRIVFTDGHTESSTNLLNAFLSNWSGPQITALQQLRDRFALGQVVEAVDSISLLRVLVVGEPTVDSYIFSDVNGTTNKTPTLSVTVRNVENYAGGSLAIANHLAALGCEVVLLIPHGDEPYYREVVAESMLPGVTVEGMHIPGFITPRKTRYVVPFQMAKLFQVVEAQLGFQEEADLRSYFDCLKGLAADVDLVMVADYGFGLFEELGIETLARLNTPIALNTQTNSTNYGFNLFTKHARFGFLSLNEREFRLGVGRRYGEVEALMQETDAIRVPFCVTVGAKGSYFRSASGEVCFCPGFFTDIVDTTGAGDAFFTVTGALVRNSFSDLVVPFIGNCYAGLQSRTIGNSLPIEKRDLIRTVSALLS